MNWLWMGLHHTAAMLWETLWALVLGFSISAAFQVVVTKEQMSRAFGRTGLREVVLATFFGAASSSCSYAAAAAGRAAFKKGAAFVPMLAFMFASTNLVVELGAVLWLLMGWHFVLAECVGAFVLIGIVWLLVALTVPKQLVEQARVHEGEGSGGCCPPEEEHEHHHDHAAHEEHGCHPHGADESSHALDNKWQRIAAAFVMDWSMLWKEILAGFLIGGFLSVLVPDRWWASLFMTQGPWALRLVENCLVGPLIAMASFVCSIGNIPLASMFWAEGISFGGVISFIYADLIIIPLILVYRKYYGGKMALYITSVFFVAMVLAGIVVDLLFTALGLVPTGMRPANPIAHAEFAWNYTTWLNIAAMLYGVAMLMLYRRRRVR
jgi:uncharacterized membrane protein YraQ (UPF0718 family)